MVFYFRAKKLRWRICISIVRGDMDESVNVVFSNSLGDSLSPFDMNVLKGEVSVEIIQNEPWGLWRG